MATLEMSDQARKILSRSTITTEAVILPPEQLDRKLYVEVNKLLEALGGKWNRKAKAHLFSDDPTPKLADVLETQGKIKYVDLKKDLSFFETPQHLAEKMVDLAELKPGDLVLEPSIGMGGIAKFIPNNCNIIGYDINRDFVQKCRDAGIVTVCQDFLLADPGSNAQYDAVVMNPPFNKGQDIEHVTHAWEFLKDGGVLVALTSKSWTFNTQKKYVKFRAFVERYLQHQETIPAGTFKDAGTNIETVLIVLRKK